MTRHKLASVLLVDDDPIPNFLHEQLLVSLGVTDHCLVAENGAEALVRLAELGDMAPPALVLLDVHMPEMGGVDFLEAYVQPPPVSLIQSACEHPRDQSRLGHQTLYPRKSPASALAVFSAAVTSRRQVT